MTEPEDTIVYWYGKPVKDMTFEELYEAFIKLGKMYRDATARHIEELGKLQ